MAIIYVDPESGNDNYAGSSFAVIYSGIDGQIATSTFTSISANFPNDGSLIGQYLSIFNGTTYNIYKITAWISPTQLTLGVIITALANQAVDRQYYIGGRLKTISTGVGTRLAQAGDTIRVKESGAASSVGLATWTDSSSGDTVKALNSVPYGYTPIRVQVNSHGYVTGDTVQIYGATGEPQVNGTYEITVLDGNTFTLDGSFYSGVWTSGTGSCVRRTGQRVMLNTAVTQNILGSGPRTFGWVLTSPVYGYTGYPYKEGGYSDVILIPNTQTYPAKIGYITLPSTLNLSGYEQISFQFYGYLISNNVGSIYIRLCSDTAGNTVVNEFLIPEYSYAGTWVPYTLNYGAPLGSSIRSVSIYVTSVLNANSTCALQFNNMIACKAKSSADSLHLNSLIGKNTATDKTFWAIRSIYGRRVMLETICADQPDATNYRGYIGTTENVTTYKKDAIPIKQPFSAASCEFGNVQFSGTSAASITISGGWNSTNMSTQTSETWLSGSCCLGYGLQVFTRSYLNIEKLGWVRFGRAVYNLAANFSNINILGVNSNSNFGGNALNCSASTITIGQSIQNFQYGFTLQGGSLTEYNLDVIINSTLDNLLIADIISPVITLDSRKAGSAGVRIGGNFTNIMFKDCKFTGNTLGAFAHDGATLQYRPSGDIFLKNCLINDVTEFPAQSSNLDLTFCSQNHDQVQGSCKIYSSWGLITTATDVYYGSPAGTSWKIQPTSSVLSSSFPMVFSLAQVACTANSLVTASIWMRRDNASLTMGLRCPANQWLGQSIDIVSYISAAINTWQQVTISFTPAQDCVAEIDIIAYGGVTYTGWIDTFSVTQA